ncbi:MAG: DinB family protein [Dehalococcoidia bacterium]
MSRIDFVTGAPEKYAHLVEALATVATRLRATVEGKRDAELRREPEGAWSAHHVLAHMALFAQRNGVFIHQMGTMTDPDRLPFDEEAETKAWMGKPAAGLIDVIEEEIAKTVEFLSGTPDASWGRPGKIRGARRSLRQQVESHGNHMAEHIEQIRTILATK